MRAGSIVAGLVLAAAAAGCAPDAGRSVRGAPEETSLPGQQWALEDGRVDAAEYGRAMNEFISCVRGAGYEVTDPVISPIDGLSLLYQITPSGDPASYNEAVQRCNLSHLSMVEPTYVESHPKVMEETLRSAVVRCLRGRGRTASGDERNATELAEAARDEPAVVECITESRVRLFPELPDEAVVRI